MLGRAFIGISGWRYASWRGRFYPTGLVQRRELEYAAERLDSVEINGSFYSLQRPESYRAWAEQTPDDFVFAVKGGRYITHMLRLRNAETALANFFGSGVLALGRRLGPVLWQLPARTEFDAATLDAFLHQLPRTAGDASVLAQRHDEKLRHEPVTAEVAEQPIRHVIEPRHDSFTSPEAIELLRHHGVALAVSDGAGHWPEMHVDTGDFVYVRLHGAEELYSSGYTAEQLRRWADGLRPVLEGGRDVYVYFDNDAEGHAPFDAMALRDLLHGSMPGRP